MFSNLILLMGEQEHLRHTAKEMRLVQQWFFSKLFSFLGVRCWCRSAIRDPRGWRDAAECSPQRNMCAKRNDFRRNSTVRYDATIFSEALMEELQALRKEGWGLIAG